MDVVFLKPFVLAVKYVFNTQLNMDVIIGKPFIRAQETISDSIAGVIGISGDAIGIITLRFPKQVIVGVASKLNGDDKSNSTHNRETAVSELIHRVSTQAKSEMQDLNISISQPKIATVQKQQLYKLKDQPVMALPCDCAFGHFTLEMSVITKQSACQ